MKKRTKIIGAFLAASSVALAIPYAAQARGGDYGFGGGCEGRGHQMHGARHMFGGHGGGHGMLRGLDLTEAQKDKIFELRHKLEPEMREQMKVVRAAGVALREMMSQGEYDAARVKTLTEERAAAMSQMAQMKFASQNEVYQLLTDEQRAELKKRKEARQERWEKRGMGPGRGVADMDT